MNCPHNGAKKRSHPLSDSPFPLIIETFYTSIRHLEEISNIIQLSIFENYENTTILRAIDSVKRDATFGTAHLIIGVSTAPVNPPA